MSPATQTTPPAAAITRGLAKETSASQIAARRTGACSVAARGRLTSRTMSPSPAADTHATPASSSLRRGRPGPASAPRLKFSAGRGASPAPRLRMPIGRDTAPAPADVNCSPPASAAAGLPAAACAGQPGTAGGTASLACASPDFCRAAPSRGACPPAMPAPPVSVRHLIFCPVCNPAPGIWQNSRSAPRTRSPNEPCHGETDRLEPHSRARPRTSGTQLGSQAVRTSRRLRQSAPSSPGPGHA
jgi:hypothetical protein